MGKEKNMTVKNILIDTNLRNIFCCEQKITCTLTF